MFLNFAVHLLIPLYTIWSVVGTNWFTTNFSALGNMIGCSEGFVLWGLMVGIYFFWCLRRTVRRMKVKPKGAFLIPTFLVLLTFALTAPYLPEVLPLKSFLHVIFVFTAAVCLMLCSYLIIWRPYQGGRETYRTYLKSLIAIICFSAFLLVLAGIISSALEVFFTISTVILVRGLLRQVDSDT